MTYDLKKYQIGCGKDTGKSIYVVTQDGAPILYTDPLTIEESIRLRRIVKEPHKMRAWINSQKEQKK